MKRRSIIILLSLITFSTSYAQRILTLEDCVNAARTNNVKVRNAKNELAMAEEQRKYARSKYYPTVSASAMHYEATDYLFEKRLLSDAWEDVLEIIDQELEIDLDMNRIKAFKRGSSAGIKLIQPLYTGGRLTKLNKLADLQVDARRLMLDMDDDILVQEAELLYMTLLKLHGKDRTLDAADKEIASILKDARNLYEEGMINSSDVLSAELAQDQLSAQHIRLNNARNLIRRALAKAIGMTGENIDIDTTITTNIVNPELLWVDPENAVDNRNETRLLDINVQRTKMETKIALANYKPMLLIGGSWGVSKYVSEAATRGLAMATLSVPISTFWSERHEVKRKRIAEQKALDERDDKREMLNIQTRDAYDNLTSTYAQIEIAKKSIVRADENLRIKHEQYINGVTNMTVLLDAQRQKQQADDQLSDALCDYQHAKTNYLILTGRKESTYGR